MLPLLLAGTLSTMLAAPPAAVDGRRLLLDCEKAFLAFETIRGTAKTRTVAYAPGETEPLVDDARSDFWYRRTDQVRFENAQPIPNTVIWNGKTLWIWSPSENAIVEEPASSAPLTTRTLLSVHPGFGLDPLAPIPLDDYAVSTAPAETAKEVVVTLEPKANAATRATLQITVDPSRRLVRRIVSLVAKGGATISDVRFSDELEARPGSWFARKSVTSELLPDGSTVESVKSYERLRFDAPIDDSKFSMAQPEGALRVRVTDVRAGEGRIHPEGR